MILHLANENVSRLVQISLIFAWDKESGWRFVLQNFIHILQNLILNQDGQDNDGVDELGNTTSTFGNWMTDFEVSWRVKSEGLSMNDICAL